MTPPSASLIGLFATSSPICVLIRRGPHHWSHQILWRTDTDEFTPGAWITGRLQFATLSSDGRFLAARFMSQYEFSLICRPPHFEPLCLFDDGPTSHSPYFTEDGRLFLPDGLRPDACPFEIIECDDTRPTGGFPVTAIDSTRGPAVGLDHHGRKIRFADGQVFEDSEEGEPRLLFDARPYRREKIKSPEWAKVWT